MLGLDMTQKTDFAGVTMYVSCGWETYVLRWRYLEALRCYDVVLAVQERIKILPSVARVAQIKKWQLPSWVDLLR